MLKKDEIGRLFFPKKGWKQDEDKILRCGWYRYRLMFFGNRGQNQIPCGLWDVPRFKGVKREELRGVFV
jgi:hypothetical protein